MVRPHRTDKRAAFIAVITSSLHFSRFWYKPARFPPGPRPPDADSALHPGIRRACGRKRVSLSLRTQNRTTAAQSM